MISSTDTNPARHPHGILTHPTLIAQNSTYPKMMANRKLTPVKSHMILTTANHHLQLYKRSLEGFGEPPKFSH